MSLDGWLLLHEALMRERLRAFMQAHARRMLASERRVTFVQWWRDLERSERW